MKAIEIIRAEIKEKSSLLSLLERYEEERQLTKIVPKEKYGTALNRLVDTFGKRLRDVTYDDIQKAINKVSDEIQALFKVIEVYKEIK